MRPLLILTTFLLLLSSPAAAQSASAVRADSEARAEAAIERVAAGLRAGRISPAERRRLDELFRRLDGVQRLIVRDGVVLPRERDYLEGIHSAIDAAVTGATNSP